MFAAFELRCWGRPLRVHWTAKRSNQSILKEISPECSLEGLMPKLKLPILWPPDAKNWLLGKDPDAGKDWRQEEKGTTEDEMIGWHHRLNGHEFEQVLGVGDDRKAWCAAVHGATKNWIWLSDWTELNWTWLYIPLLPLWCLWIIFKTPFHSNCILIICLKLSCSAEEHRLLKPSMLLLPLTSHDLGH